VRFKTTTLCLLALYAPLAAALPTNPVAIVEYLYAHPDSVYTRNWESLSAAFFTPRLVALYRKDRKDHEGDVPNLDFDFLSNSQDPGVTQVKVALDGHETRKDHQAVTVHFLDTGEPEIEVFTFDLLRGRWLISEVQCKTPGRTWILSKVMEGHPE
jgi:hypothetical protein